MLEGLGIIAAILEIIALYLLGRRIRIGWIFNISAGLSWITYSILSGSAYGLIIVCSVNLFLNSKGFYNWGKDNGRQSSKSDSQ